MLGCGSVFWLILLVGVSGRFFIIMRVVGIIKLGSFLCNRVCSVIGLRLLV